MDLNQLAPLSAAAWILERFPASDQNFRFGNNLQGIVPDGFNRYIRVFHPTEHSRPVGMTWQELVELQAAEKFGEFPEFESEPIGWRRVAESFGKSMHPLVQFSSLVGTKDPNTLDLVASDGWRYEVPPQGMLPIDTFTSVMKLLSDIPSGSVNGHALSLAIWEGWGGLTSSDGAAYLSIDEGPLKCRTFYFVDRVRRFLDGTLFSWLPRKLAAPGSGLLTVEAATAERLELPHRSYILFSSALGSFLDHSWAQKASWAGSVTHPQTPSLVWPADQAWVLVSEIDFDSTIIACADDVADALLSHPQLEALEVSFDSDLSHSGDRVNPII